MPAPIWKAPTPRFTRRSRTMKTVCGLCSASSRLRARAQSLRAARTNSMHEGGELGYSLVHAFGAPSIIQT